ncbi:MAG: calcium-binding protein [Arenibacterium sp.]
MTTYIFEGINVSYFFDPTTGEESDNFEGTAQLRVVVGSRNESFSYTIVDIDGLAEVDFNGDVEMASINGNNIDALEEQFGTTIPTEIGDVTWSGGVTTILAFSIETGNNSDTEFYFDIGGVALPNITNNNEWSAFRNSITLDGVTSGALGPNRTIDWEDLTFDQVTQEDEFAGTSGNDRFNGGVGDDYFTSSAGDDNYIGGGGKFDQLNYSRDPGAVTVNFARGTATDGFGDRDTFSGIEMVRSSLFDDTLVGKKGSQIFRGLQGEDNINGAKGIDTVRHDRDYRFDGGDNGVIVNLKRGFAIDGFGDQDTLRSIENAVGTNKADKFVGTGGKNVFVGLNGKDRFDGLGGNDTFTGGGGNDRFVFKGNFGNDVITDFTTKGKKEKIDISDIASIRNFKDLKNNHLSNENGNAVIDDGNGNTITINDVLKGALLANDFLF